MINLSNLMILPEELIKILGHLIEDSVLTKATQGSLKIQMCGILHHQLRKKPTSQLKKFRKTFHITKVPMGRPKLEGKRVWMLTESLVFFFKDIPMATDLTPI